MSGSTSAWTPWWPRGPLRRCGERTRRAQLEVGQRGLQVEPRPAHRQRAPPGGQSGVDLRVCARGELTGREGLAGLQEGQQPVLEAILLLRRRRSRQQLQAPVDLKRVHRYGQRVLTAFAQLLGQSDRHGGLAHPGGPEQGDHAHDR